MHECYYGSKPVEHIGSARLCCYLARLPSLPSSIVNVIMIVYRPVSTRKQTGYGVVDGVVHSRLKVCEGLRRCLHPLLPLRLELIQLRVRVRRSATLLGAGGRKRLAWLLMMRRERTAGLLPGDAKDLPMHRGALAVE